jgi:hypothetical protein
MLAIMLQTANFELISAVRLTWASPHQLRNSVTKIFRQVSQRHSSETQESSSPSRLPIPLSFRSLVLRLQ